MLGVEQLLLPAATTTGTGTAVDLKGQSREITIYIITTNATVTTGAVQIEEADDPTYAGTWSPIGSPVTPVANSQIVIRATGCFKAVRARVTTDLTGGATISVRLAGNSGE
jgi:hypothetical protein